MNEDMNKKFTDNFYSRLWLFGVTKHLVKYWKLSHNESIEGKTKITFNSRLICETLISYSVPCGTSMAPVTHKCIGKRAAVTKTEFILNHFESGIIDWWLWCGFWAHYEVIWFLSWNSPDALKIQTLFIFYYCRYLSLSRGKKL